MQPKPAVAESEPSPSTESTGTMPHDSAADESPAPSAPVVKKNSSILMFSWFEGDVAKTTMDMDEIPDNVKKEVRVQDLAIPPDQRDPAWIFLTDLTEKNSSGSERPESPRDAAQLAGEVRRLVRQLDADDLTTRDQAERQLVELGAAVLDHLPNVTARTPAEVKERLGRVIRVLERVRRETDLFQGAVCGQGSRSQAAGHRVVPIHTRGRDLPVLALEGKGLLPPRGADDLEVFIQ